MVVEGMQATDRIRLRRRGFALEWATLVWNVMGVVVLAIASISAGSVALAGSVWIV
ncbi:hypothetical protein [Arthrobacter sp. H5]|uniref:hypothetical protein n=1 Tax=Arthrobacter sp. H5 TaxID=1267973 RepID=UPI0004AD9F68|nr:hypothetical protein [Arthrobacter sp. H5]